MRDLPLDKLPLYSAWVERLLNASQGTLFPKTKDSIFKEYEHDKWGAIWADVQAGRPSLDDIEIGQFGGQQEIAISFTSDLYLAPPLEARETLARHLADAVFAVHSPGKTVVELGAGTGALITRIAKDPRFNGSRFAATDFSPSSIKLIDYVATSQGVAIETGLFDLNSDANDFSLPHGCTLLLSFCLAYAERLDDRFWSRLAQYRPASIVVAEPVYQFFRSDTLLGLLRKRYHEANDYSRDILSSIERAVRHGVLTIASIEENSVGINPLCPVSVISLQVNGAL